MACEHRVELGGFANAAVQQRVQVHAVELVETLLFQQVGLDLGAIGLGHQPLVQALQRDLARAPPCRLRRGAFRRRGVHEMSSIRFAISTATRAASRPLSSTRASAWASFSTVRIALAIGSRWSSATRVTPAPLSLATSSK